MQVVGAEDGRRAEDTVCEGLEPAQVCECEGSRKGRIGGRMGMRLCRNRVVLRRAKPLLFGYAKLLLVVSVFVAGLIVAIEKIMFPE